jgi:Mg2+/Co2+ transporter CorC
LVIGELVPKRLALLTVPENIDRTLLRQPVVVPEQTLKVLEKFRQTTAHIALIIHKYGGVLAWSAQQTFLKL